MTLVDHGGSGGYRLRGPQEVDTAPGGVFIYQKQPDPVDADVLDTTSL